MMEATHLSGCQWSNDAMQERKWTGSKQSKKERCQAMNKQSLQLPEITLQQF